MDDHKFKKGNPGGPGPPKLSENDRIIAALTKTQAKAIYSRLVRLSLDELKIRAKDTSLSALEHVVMRSILKAIQFGEHKRIEGIMDRIIGKVKEEKEYTIFTPRVIKNLRDGSETILKLDGAEE